jgi:hypothetical protein
MLTTPVKVRKLARSCQCPKTPVKQIEGRGRSRPYFLFIFFENNLNHFIHFQLQNNAPHALKLLGKIIPVPLKYLIFAMQNSSCGTPHGSDFL